MSPRKPRRNNPNTSEAWATLSPNHRLPSTCDPLSLLDDACLILDSAQGLARLLCDLLAQTEDANQGDLAAAMWGMATLIERGQCSAHEAQRRLSAVRKKV